MYDSSLASICVVAGLLLMMWTCLKLKLTSMQQSVNWRPLSTATQVSLLFTHVSHIGLNCYGNLYFTTHTRLTALFPGLPRWAGTRKVKPIWILPKQVTVSGSGISWAICKSASCSRQITTPTSHHSVFYRPDALPAAQPTASKHWSHQLINWSVNFKVVKPLQRPLNRKDHRPPR